MEEKVREPIRRKRAPYSGLVNKATFKEIAAKRIKGETFGKIDEDVGVSRSTIYKNLRDPKSELRQQIELQTRRLMEIVPEAVDLVRDTIDSANNSPVRSGSGLQMKEREANIRLRKVAIEASDSVLKTAGILPGVAQSIHVQNLVIGTQESLSPLIAKLLGIKEDMKAIDISPIVDPLFQDVEYKELKDGSMSAS